MSDLGAVLLAVGCVAGAMLAKPVPLTVALAVVAVAFVSRRSWVLVLGAVLLASCLATRSWAGLEPRPAQPVDAVVTLVSDPEPVAGALRAELRLDDRRIEAWARGAAAGALYHRLAGERVRVTGVLRPLPAEARSRLAVRHIAARLSVRTVSYVSGGTLPARLANASRRVLANGARSLGRDQRSLFAGFVLGDDREQAPAVADDFRASGLTHLLVVSGANVAFVLAVVAPVLGRMPRRARLVAGVAVLVAFGLVTRWEPSVLRAIAMATITLWAGAAGRPASGLRVLSLAVAALVLIDPLLVRSLGFRLSVGACIGIALLARPIAARLPGPRSLATAIGVTVGAQAGVAPILVPTFGPLPLASLPANLMAVPAAAPIMVWGMTAGFAAGVSPPLIATMLHLPTRLLIGWVAWVARTGAGLPLGRAGVVVLLLAAAAFGAAAIGPARLRRSAAAVAVVVLASPAATALARSPPRLADARLAPGLRAWRAGGATVLVVGGARSRDVLVALREHRVGRADLVVVTAADPDTAETVAALRDRLRPRAVAGVGGSPLVAGDAIAVGPWRVTVESGPPRIAVAVCAHGGTTVGLCG